MLSKVLVALALLGGASAQVSLCYGNTMDNDAEAITDCTATYGTQAALDASSCPSGCSSGTPSDHPRCHSALDPIVTFYYFTRIVQQLCTSAPVRSVSWFSDPERVLKISRGAIPPQSPM